MEFVQDILVPKATDNAIKLVVMRQAKTWAIRKSTGVIAFNGAESRGAHISHRTAAGKELLKYLDLA